MKKLKKFLFLFFAFIIVFSTMMPPVFATSKQGKITGSNVYMRNKATTSGSTILYTFSNGTVVTINSKTTGQEAVSGSGTTWYNVTYSGKTGYVYGKYIQEITTTTDTNFENSLKNFPSSYRSALRKIHNTYPNWVFVADKLTISLDTAINYEHSSTNLSSIKKWVELSYGIDWRDSRVNIKNSAHIKESRWTYASRQAIGFFMDPRNALVVTNSKASFPNIFTFLQQSYDSSTQTKSGLKSVVSGTFLANGYGGKTDAYLDDIMQAAKDSGVSPYVIASTIRIEQGVNGTSSLISGKYKGYEGYYNFFNYGASGSNVVLNGLKYAKNKGWNSRRKAIIGGAKLYASGYISVGQDTYYYMDFNVKYPSKIWHQYATSLYDQCTKAVSMRTVCTANKNASLTFKIPVYTSLPSSKYGIPKTHTCVAEIRNAKAATCTAKGYSGDKYCKICGVLMSSGKETNPISHTKGIIKNYKAPTCLDDGYSGDVYCKICGTFIENGSIIKSPGHIYDEWIIDTPAGETTNGYCHCVCTACGVVKNHEIPPLSVRIAGDINDDGAIDNKDLTALFKYLSNHSVSVNQYALDVDVDGQIDNKDFTRLFKYLTGYRIVLV